MSQTPSIPEGHKRNAQGHLVPLELIKPIDIERDELVSAIIERGRKLRDVVAKFKGETFADIAAFVQLSAEQYSVKLGGEKGNVTLLSFDGRYKVVRQIAEHLVFDERLQAAQQLIGECIEEWSQGSGPEIRALVNDAFDVDNAGRINTGKVLSLRRLEISHPKWLEAMRAIGESVQVAGTKPYIRLYEKVNEQWLPIPIDVASV